ncbi:MAG: PilZ domain-containing protein [candidate division KSB1 bacterium]|nr:PilZ domain-containing protein [candidate division KSB1 bacterium]
MPLFFKDQILDIHLAGESSDVLQRTHIIHVDDENETITVSAYDHKGNLLQFPISAEVEFFFVRPDAIYSVDAEVIDKVVRPDPGLILRPDQQDIRRIQRRQYFRVVASVKVVFIFTDRETGETRFQEETTYTRNLSAGGLLCPVKTRCQRGMPVKIQLFLPSEPTPIEAVGKVVRVQEMEDDQEYPFRIGVEFEDIQESDRSRLTRFLFKVQAKKAGK